MAVARPRETKGSRTLRASALTNEGIVRALREAEQSYACTVAAVDSWRHGRRSPELGARVAMASAGLVTFDAWEQLPDVAAPREPAPPAAPLPEGGASRSATIALADRLTAEADRQLRALEQDTDAENAAARGRDLRELAAVIAQLGKITGVALDERVVLRSPALRSVRDAIDRALTPWPEAAAAVVEALRALEGDEA